MEEVKIIQLNERIVKLTIHEFTGNIDVDDMLSIDYSNILGEILTFPVLLNRLGMLLADIEDHLRKENFQLEKAKDELDEKRAIAEIEAYKTIKEKQTNVPTRQQIENEVRLSKDHQKHEEEFRNRKLILLNTQKDRDYINSLYWSAKSKDEKLN